MEFGWAEGRDNANKSFGVKVKQDILEKILDLLKSKIYLKDPSLKLLFESQTPAGSYHLKSADNDFFIRVSSRLGDFELENQFVDYLISKQVYVNKFLFGGINFSWKESLYRLDVRPFIEGRYFDANIKDFEKLVESMKQFHQSAYDFPNFKKIRFNQQKISSKQEKICKELQEALQSRNFKYFTQHEEWVKKNCDWLDKILGEYNPYFEDMSGAQCLHGQIHPGNVLFVDSQAILFDTETSIHTFAPVDWDYSWVLQRFIINQDIEKKESLKYLELLAYSPTGINRLLNMTKQNTICSVVSVFDYCLNKNVSVPQSELDKFYNNYMSMCEYELYLREVYEI